MAQEQPEASAHVPLVACNGQVVVSSLEIARACAGARPRISSETKFNKKRWRRLPHDNYRSCRCETPKKRQSLYVFGISIYRTGTRSTISWKRRAWALTYSHLCINRTTRDRFQTLSVRKLTRNNTRIVNSFLDVGMPNIENPDVGRQR